MVYTVEDGITAATFLPRGKRKNDLRDFAKIKELMLVA